MSSPPAGQRLRVRIARPDVIRLAASLILSVLLWGWVTDAQDPETTRQFPNVTIEVGELPSPLQIVGSIPDVSIRVTGPRSVVSDLTTADVTAELDIDDVEAPGEYTLDIDVNAPGGVWETEVVPSRLPIQFEESVTRQFVIEAEITGTFDATRQIDASVVDTSEATVLGPRSSVERVARVVAPVEIENQTRDFSTTVVPQAVDAGGQPIPEVQVSPGTVRVDVAIDARGKRVAVITQLEGLPAQGYEVVDRTINPATVLVDGPDEIVNELISVSTEPIDISGATTTITRRVSITSLPEGLVLIDPADGLIDVVIQVRQLGVTQELPAQSVQVVGLADGLAVELSPDAVGVTVVAPEAMLSGLTTSQLTVQVNVAGLGPGTYELVPIVALPPNVTWIASSPPAVAVVITSIATPAAGGQATPTSIS